jgi:hypothetical protein
MGQSAKEIIARKREMLAGKARHIERFCDLRRKVNEQVFAFAVPSDCLCRRGEAAPFPDGWDWQDSGKVIEFIEQAVAEKIEREA